MSFKVLIIAVVLCVLVIDAIRYRIIYFKFKRLGIVDYSEISEHLNMAKTQAIKVNVKNQEEAERKMILLTSILTYLSELEESEVNFLVEDLDFLLFNYEKYGKPLTKLVDTDKDIIDEEDENL